MRIAWFGLDLFAPALAAALEAGAELTALFTGPGDGLTDFSTRIRALAEERGVPVTLEKPDRAQVAALFQTGTDCILSAYYPYRIPVEGVPGFRGYNLHPGYLPEDRGPWPQGQALARGYGGLTLHRLAQSFDTGDILLRQRLPLTEYDTIDTLNARLQLAAPDLLRQFLARSAQLDAAAFPQGDGHYDPLPDPAAYTLTGAQTVAQARRLLAVYGRGGCFVRLPEGEKPVTAGWFYPAAHAYQPGTVAVRNEKDLIMAFRDGFGVLVL